jgi:hypothetical protein
MNGDGEADIVYLAMTGAVDPDPSPMYNYGTIPAHAPPDYQPNDADRVWPPVNTTLPGRPATIPGLTRWIDINTGQFSVSVGDLIRYLDHEYEITGISADAITVKVWYAGNSIPGSPTTLNVPAQQTLSVGRHLANVENLTLMAGGITAAYYQSPSLPPSQSDKFQLGVSKLQLVTEPAYLQVISTSGTSAQVVVGRLITEGESFFVDGMEMAVSMIYMVPTPANGQNKDDPLLYGMKFITIRTPLPKVPVTLEALTIEKCVVNPCPDLIPMLPPFNMEHDMIDDVNIPDVLKGDPNCEVYPDVENRDNYIGEMDLINNITGAPVPDGFGDMSGLSMAYNTIAKRRVQDVEPIEECWLKETKEPRFDTNLLEEKFYPEQLWPSGTVGSQATGLEELWWWKNIETYPWDYTEFILPELPEAAGLEDMGYIGDYILVSSFWTQDWFTFVESIPGGPLVKHIEQVRVKFDYDAAFSSSSVTDYVEGDPPYPESKSGLYVNTINVEPVVPPALCDYDDPANGGNGNGVIDKQEAINAIVDYFDGAITKALAIEVIVAYFGQTQC